MHLIARHRSTRRKRLVNGETPYMCILQRCCRFATRHQPVCVRVFVFVAYRGYRQSSREVNLPSVLEFDYWIQKFAAARRCRMRKPLVGLH